MRTRNAPNYPPPAGHPPAKALPHILAGINRALEAGIQQLNDVERALACAPEHLDELRRRLRAAYDADVPSNSPNGLQLATAADSVEAAAAGLWPHIREAWRETHAALIAARRTIAEDDGESDHRSLDLLRASVEKHLAQLSNLGEENPWAVPGPDDGEARRCRSGMHAIDAATADYLDHLGPEGTPLRTVGHEAAAEIRGKARQRWADWTAGGRDPPWQRWRNRALFPTILARVLWRGDVQGHVARLRTKPPATIYAVFRSIASVSSQQLELGLDDQGHRAIMRRDNRRGLTAVADVPTLSEEIFTRGLTLLGSRYTLPTVEWLVERAHTQALQGADRPDVIEVEGGWETFTSRVLEKRVVHPRERAIVRSLVGMLAGTPIRWQDGARSSSLFMVFENPSAAGRGRGRSMVRFTLDARLLEHEHHRARDRFGAGAGPAQWADWRIVPLPRPRNVVPLNGSPRDTYGPQAVALRLLWLFFTRHGDQLLERPRLIQIAPHDRKAIAEDAHLPTRFIDPLLAHLVQQGAIIAGPSSRFAPSDPAARAFIAEGWRRSRLASESGQRAAQARASGAHAPS